MAALICCTRWREGVARGARMQRTRSPLHTGTAPHLTGSSLRVRLSAEGTEVEAAQRRELDSKECFTSKLLVCFTFPLERGLALPHCSALLCSLSRRLRRETGRGREGERAPGYASHDPGQRRGEGGKRRERKRPHAPDRPPQHHGSPPPPNQPQLRVSCWRRLRAWARARAGRKTRC